MLIPYLIGTGITLLLLVLLRVGSGIGFQVFVWLLEVGLVEKTTVTALKEARRGWNSDVVVTFLVSAAMWPLYLYLMIRTLIVYFRSLPGSRFEVLRDLDEFGLLTLDVGAVCGYQLELRSRTQSLIAEGHYSPSVFAQLQRSRETVLKTLMDEFGVHPDAALRAVKAVEEETVVEPELAATRARILLAEGDSRPVIKEKLVEEFGINMALWGVQAIEEEQAPWYMKDVLREDADVDARPSQQSLFDREWEEQDSEEEP